MDDCYVHDEEEEQEFTLFKYSDPEIGRNMRIEHEKRLIREGGNSFTC